MGHEFGVFLFLGHGVYRDFPCLQTKTVTEHKCWNCAHLFLVSQHPKN